GQVGHAVDRVDLRAVGARPAVDELGRAVAGEDSVLAPRAHAGYAAADGVGPDAVDVGAAVHDVVAVGAAQHVLAGVAAHVVVAGVAVQLVVAAAAGQAVVAGPAVEDVPGRVPGHRVVSAAAVDDGDVPADVVALARRAVVRHAVEADVEV